MMEMERERATLEHEHAKRSARRLTVLFLALLALPGTILAAGCRGPTWKIEMRLVLGSGGFVVSSGLR
ncbi:hypothetical protein V8C43DRAFT_282714 [Trichoderma afarasin]